ncbi:MAG: hypothetical protein N4A54_06870 [Peptostreptococcaceae bacterium]|nr:hypothetical protein [Peptostreptococcaceae bacterium]
MKKNKTKIYGYAFGFGCIVSFMSWIYYKFIPKMSLKKYTQACLYLAVMDDEICRNELEGEYVDGKEINFPQRRESLQYKYRLFLDMYKTYSKRKLEKIIKEYEERLEESKY